MLKSTTTEFKFQKYLDPVEEKCKTNSEDLYEMCNSPYNNISASLFDMSIYNNNPYGRDYKENMKQTITNEMVDEIYGGPINISYSEFGRVGYGPTIFMIPGVPSNKGSFATLARLMSPFAHIITIDMLNMGESTKVIDDDNYHEMFKWCYDPFYLRDLFAVIQGRSSNMYKDPRNGTLMPREKSVILVASDWGGGIAQWYASMFNEDMAGVSLIDPISLDGYPVHEIQAIGRMSMVPDDSYPMVAGDLDSKLIQIQKTMMMKTRPINNYTARNFTKAYVENDYERPGNDYTNVQVNPSRKRKVKIGGATSLTLDLNFKNFKAMAHRSAVLSPTLLLPYHSELNPDGLIFGKIKSHVQIIWGLDDNMMPPAQRQRLRALFYKALSVNVNPVLDAGHFVEQDQPRLVSEFILSWVESNIGFSLYDTFMGFGLTKMKGDEEFFIQRYNEKFRRSLS